MKNVNEYKKQIITKKNRRVALRVPRKRDVEELMRYINALVEEDTFISQTKKVTRKQEGKYLAKRLKAIKKVRGFNILVEYKGKIIAHGEVTRAGMRREHLGELGISVVKGFRDEGLGTVLIKEMLRLAKEFLKLNIVYLYVYANNKRARYFYKKIGFRECGRIPKAILYRGKYVDQVFMYVDLGKLNSG